MTLSIAQAKDNLTKLAEKFKQRWQKRPNPKAN